MKALGCLGCGVLIVLVFLALCYAIGTGIDKALKTLMGDTRRINIVLDKDGQGDCWYVLSPSGSHCHVSKRTWDAVQFEDKVDGKWEDSELEFGRLLTRIVK